MDRPGLGPTERRCLEEAGKGPGARSPSLPLPGHPSIWGWAPWLCSWEEEWKSEEENLDRRRNPGAPPGCPLELGLQLSCHSPLSLHQEGRVRALDTVPLAVRTRPKLLACGPSHEPWQVAPRQALPSQGQPPSQGQLRWPVVGQD